MSFMYSYQYLVVLGASRLALLDLLTLRAGVQFPAAPPGKNKSGQELTAFIFALEHLLTPR